MYSVWCEKTSARAFNMGSRIDYALASPGMMEHIVSCEFAPDLPPRWSDHAALVIELKGAPAATRARPAVYMACLTAKPLLHLHVLLKPSSVNFTLAPRNPIVRACMPHTPQPQHTALIIASHMLCLDASACSC